MSKAIGSFPAHMDAHEAKICNRLITIILKDDDMHIRVWDGEDWSTVWTRDRPMIQRNTAATDHTLYYISKRSDGGDYGLIGYIFLVHGNGEDIITDAGWSSKHPEHEAILDAYMDHASKNT